MKYYYAVVDCADVKTASSLYAQCDGLEYLRSGNMIDLRYMPDDMVIPRPPRSASSTSFGLDWIGYWFLYLLF